MSFGDILDQWENTREGRGKSTGVDRRKELESLIDRYSVPAGPKEESGEKLHPGNSRQQLRQMKPQAEIDLHGMTRAEAQTALLEFIDDCTRRGLKKIRIIHGKGNHSSGSPVLGEFVRSSIERHPRCGEFGYSKGQEGGRGAMWVILRYRSR